VYLCVFVYVLIYVYIHICVYVCTSTHVLRLQICTCVKKMAHQQRALSNMYEEMNMNEYIHIHINVYMYIYMYACMYNIYAHV